MDKRWLNVAPFLDFTTNVEDAQLGGFFLNFNFLIQGHPVPLVTEGPNLFYHSVQRWKLFAFSPRATA